MVDRIRTVHAKHIEAARATALRLAGDAAESTEEGIRDIVDEDDEADTAIRAAIVRQMSTTAMQAFRRLTELEMAGDAIAFGRMDRADDEPGSGRHNGDRTEAAGADPEQPAWDARLYIGRMSVLDGEDVLLVDWRAPASAPFYQATPLAPLGVTHRRHLMYGDGTTADPNELIGWSDEIFDVDALGTTVGLRGEAAILASVEAPTEAQMKSVVATIQAEQDRIIRAPANGALVVQGAPGTGKTVVALHRAAWLLYNQRAALAESGVLIVGPTTEFLTYIAGVLPSLGETGVVSVTVNDLFTDVRRGHEELPETAALKGQLEMAALLANAVGDRQRTPTADLVVRYGSDRVRLPLDELLGMFAVARRYRTHNDGAEALRTAIIEALAHRVHNPAFGNWDDAIRTFSSSRTIRTFLLRHWPPLTPEQALNDLCGSRALLHLAARDVGLSAADRDLLWRERTPEANLADRRWSEADLPLLDELLALLGVTGENRDLGRILERDERDEFELAEESDESDDAAETDTADEEPETDADRAALVATRMTVQANGPDDNELEEWGFSLADAPADPSAADRGDDAPVDPRHGRDWIGGDQLG